jgi:hypothetical protein
VPGVAPVSFPFLRPRALPALSFPRTRAGDRCVGSGSPAWRGPWRDELVRALSADLLLLAFASTARY